MEFTLERRKLESTYTMGQLFTDGWFECFTLEDTVRDREKIQDKTAIPYGRYKVIINMSARFKRLMPLLLNVPGFEGIRIHPGNTAADTSGCILVGKIRGIEMILDSRSAFEPLYLKINAALESEEEVWVNIKEANA